MNDKKTYDIMEDDDMLSTEQEIIINEQLLKDNSSEFVKTLMNRYANTVENVSELLDYIPKLAEKQLRMKQSCLNQYSWGMNMLIVDRDIHPGKYTKDDRHMRFCTLYYVCKIHFKNGNAEHNSVACRNFFNEFIEMLKEKKEFDYTNDKDWDWIYSTAGGAEWLEDVIKQHIDPEFMKPNDRNTRWRKQSMIMND